MIFVRRWPFWALCQLWGAVIALFMYWTAQKKLEQYYTLHRIGIYGFNIHCTVTWFTPGPQSWHIRPLGQFPYTEFFIFGPYLEADNFRKVSMTRLILHQGIVGILYSTLLLDEAFAVDTFSLARRQKWRFWRRRTVKSHPQTLNRHISGTNRDICKILFVLCLLWTVLYDKSHLKAVFEKKFFLAATTYW